MNLFRIASRLLFRISSLQSVQQKATQEFGPTGVYEPTLKVLDGDSSNIYSGNIKPGWDMKVEELPDGKLKILLNNYPVNSFKEAAEACKKKDPNFLPKSTPVSGGDIASKIINIFQDILSSGDRLDGYLGKKFGPFYFWVILKRDSSATFLIDYGGSKDEWANLGLFWGQYEGSDDISSRYYNAGFDSNTPHDSGAVASIADWIASTDKIPGDLPLKYEIEFPYGVKHLERQINSWLEAWGPDTKQKTGMNIGGRDFKDELNKHI